MRGLTWVVAGVVLLLAAGCGTAAETSSTNQSEAPDAVATAEAESSSSASADTGSTDASVVVDGAGYSVCDYPMGPGQQVGYGLVLKNTSTTMDAEEVQVTINLMNKSGAVLATEDSVLSLIPTGSTFYFGAESLIEKGDKPTKMEAYVDVGSSVAAQNALPKVTNVRVVNDPSLGVTVKGQVKNDFTAPLSSSALIGCVLFGANDKVVGGGFGYLKAKLPPGRTAAVWVGNGVYATPASKVKRAEVSMENAGE